jgi:TatD DNase family protein
MTGVLLAWAREAAAVFGDTPPGVMHYFSAGVETAERFVDAGFLISVHTSVTHPRAEQLREVAAALPLECLLVETDSPYGAPQSRRGRRNEPAYVVEAAARIAVLRGIPIEAVAETTTANARRLFGLPAIAAEGAVTA